MYQKVITVLPVNDPNCVTCNNVTYGGLIEGEEKGCTPYVAEEIISVDLASGGSGAVQYQWMVSDQNTPPTGLNDPNWELITGATINSYSPGTINSTKYYIRLSKSTGCQDWMLGLSNVVKKGAIGAAISPSFESEDVICTAEFTDYIAANFGPGAIYEWYFFNGSTTNSTFLGSREGQDVEFQFTSDGEKLIRLYVETEYGCSATIDQLVTVLPVGHPDCTEGFVQSSFDLDLSINDFDEVLLDWTTGNEGINVFYEVQHSLDGIDFETIETVEGKETASASYEYLHEEPSFGINYYRIKQYYTDGNYNFSTVKEAVLKFSDSSTGIVYPNPAVNQATLQMSEPFKSETIIEVTSAAGQTLEIITVPAGTSQVSIDLSKYKAGYYFIYSNDQGYKKLINKVLKVVD